MTDMTRKTKKLVYNTVIVCLLLAGLAYVCARFVHPGVEYTDNAQVCRHITPVNTRVQGFVRKICFDEYQPVSRGDTLLLIEDAEFRLRLAQAEADLANALAGQQVTDAGIATASNNLLVSDAAIDEARVQLDNAERDYRRYEKLLGQGAVTRQEYDHVRTAYEAAQARYEQLSRAGRSTSLLRDEQARRRGQNEAAVRLARAAVELVKPLLEGFPTLEALSSFEFFQKGLVENPVPSNNHIEPFVGHVRELWTYYCCSQESRVPNRFIAMPSRRNRIMGVLSYVYDLAGFLQWGFNFYFSQYSRKLIDPFASTDSDGAFPAGDPFLVYPGQGGKPLDSIRHEVFYDGLQDLRALRLLESKIGREAVLALIGEHLTMEEYPRRDEWLRGMRERVYRELAARR